MLRESAWGLGVLIVVALLLAVTRPQTAPLRALSEGGRAGFATGLAGSVGSLVVLDGSPPAPREEVHTWGRYVLRIRSVSWQPATFELLHDGHVVARNRDEVPCLFYGIAQGTTFGQTSRLGAPVLCVQGYWGGTYPHGPMYVYVLGETPRLLAYRPDCPGYAEFGDFDQSGGLQLICADPECLQSFKRYPNLIFRVTHRGFELAPDLMSRQPIPSLDALHLEAQALRDIRATAADPDYLWDLGATSTMDELIHSGREDLAWAFFDEAWPAGMSGKAARRHEYRARLHACPWFAQLERMQKMPHLPSLHTQPWIPPLSRR